MAFFRNKEIQKLSAALGLVCLPAIAVGFYLQPACGLLVTALCVLLCLLFYLFTRARYQNISGLSAQIDLILHGRDALDIAACDEGELSILQSELYKMTIRLKEQADAQKLEKLNLSDALANIAHQLRTPLTSMRLIAAFLQDPELSSDRRLVLARELEQLLAHVDWLLTTLLKIAKIDAGTAVFQKECIRVKDLLTLAAKPFDIPLEIRQIALTISGDFEACFTGDLQWSAEALGNMIKNAMEHMPGGGALALEVTANPLYTQLTVKDTGTGIAPEDLPHIFERFYQGKNNQSNSFGVGLALSRMILARQNATVKVSNNPEGGACFTIRYYHQTI